LCFRAEHTVETQQSVAVEIDGFIEEGGLAATDQPHMFNKYVSPDILLYYKFGNQTEMQIFQFIAQK
jgi:hypothetical protein